MIILILLLLILIYYYYIKDEYINYLYIDKSLIHGNGLYTNKIIKSNEYILNIIKNNELFNVSKLGKLVNHSLKCNSYLKKNNNRYDLYALFDIYPNTEIVANYNLNPWFLKPPGDDFI